LNKTWFAADFLYETKGRENLREGDICLLCLHFPITPSRRNSDSISWTF